MISRRHRFVGPLSLRYVYKKGRTARGPLFSIKTAPNNRRSTYHAAVVVSRKVHKSAVARNRIRRRLYEIVRRLEKDIPGPFDIVITVYSGDVLTEPAKNLDRQLRRQLADAEVLAKRLS